jgi:hypothetical protein
MLIPPWGVGIIESAVKMTDGWLYSERVQWSIEEPALVDAREEPEKCPPTLTTVISGRICCDFPDQHRWTSSLRISHSLSSAEV